jgi:hypothetical protein
MSGRVEAVQQWLAQHADTPIERLALQWLRRWSGRFGNEPPVSMSPRPVPTLHQRPQQLPRLIPVTSR